MGIRLSISFPLILFGGALLYMGLWLGPIPISPESAKWFIYIGGTCMILGLLIQLLMYPKPPRKFSIGLFIFGLLIAVIALISSMFVSPALSEYLSSAGGVLGCLLFLSSIALLQS